MMKKMQDLRIKLNPPLPRQRQHSSRLILDQKFYTMSAVRVINLV